MNKNKATRKTTILSPLNIALIALGLIYGLYRSIDMAWVCDDAFITFRYAKNFVDGHGLVFNIGERVEGYTSFLWTMLMSIGQLAKIEIIRFSQILSIGAYVATALLLVLFSSKLFESRGRKTVVWIPVAALSVLVMRDYHVWATAGMETSLAALMITAVTYALVFARSRWQFGLAGLLSALAAMTRPEALILVVVGSLFILVAERRRWHALVYFLIPFIVVFVPYWLVRYNYYGYPFPNTYYAKSGDLAYWSQGWNYLWLFVKTYYVLFLFVPAAILIVSRAWRQYRGQWRELDVASRVGLLSLLICVPSVIYVVRVGGDFMFARFFIPVIPVCYLAIEAALTSFSKSAVVKTAVGMLVVMASLLSMSQFKVPTGDIDGITDEHAMYPERMIKQAQWDGALLKRVFDGVDSVTVAFYGMRAMLMYYSELPMAIEAHSGLTDEYIAHMPITERGRPGHEKQAPYEYLKRRKVLFSFPSPGRLPEVSRIRFGNREVAILHWDNRVMEHLKKFPEVRFIDFRSYFDRYIENSYNRPDHEVTRDLAYFKQFYFDWNDDRERVEQIRQRLGE